MFSKEEASHFNKTALVSTIYILGLAFVIFTLKNPLGTHPATLLFALILVSFFGLQESWKHMWVDRLTESSPLWTWPTIPVTLFQLVTLSSFVIPALRWEGQFDFVSIFATQIIVMLPFTIHGWIFFFKKVKAHGKS